MQKTDMVIKSNYIRDIIAGDELRPAEHTKLVREIADRVIKEGTENTASGSWMAYFEEFGDKELFITNNSDEIVNELYKHQEVAEADVADDAFNMTFYLDYCPNIEEQEEELFTPEQREEDNKVKVGDKFSLNGRKWEVKGFDGLYPEQAVITRTEQSGDLVYDVTQNIDISELLSKGQRIKPEQGENTDLSAVLDRDRTRRCKDEVQE